MLAELFWCGVVADADYTRLVSGVGTWQRWGGPPLADAFNGGCSPNQLQGLKQLGLDETAAGLVGVLEPVKWYARLLGEPALQARLGGTEMPQARPYQTTTPLRSIADLISPQSGVASRFGALLARWRSAALNADDAEQLEVWLSVWEQAPQALGKLAPKAATHAGLVELAERLQRFAGCVRQQLLPHASKTLTANRLAKLDVAELNALQEPVGELLLGCVAPLLACRISAS